jgi:hypothetical protein
VLPRGGGARTLVALALVLMLAGAGAAHAKATGSEEWRDLGPRAPAQRAACAEVGPVARETAPQPEAARLVGQVVAIDAGAGVVVLATPRGMVALEGSQESMGRLGVGDVVVVELVDEEDAPAASPRLDTCV